MTTGGSTSGRCTKASSSVWPTKRRRVSTQAKAIANGRLNTTLRAATLKLRCSASISFGVSHIILVRHGAGLHSGRQYTAQADHLEDLLNDVLSRRGARGRCARTHRCVGRQPWHAGFPVLLRRAALLA